MSSLPIFDRNTMMALLSEGFAVAEVARRLGCTASLVSQVGRRHGHNGRTVREAMLRRRALDRADREADETGPPVPAEYRAAGLADDYRDLVRDFGPVEGTRRCRRLLSETRTLSPEARS